MMHSNEPPAAPSRATPKRPAANLPGAVPPTAYHAGARIMPPLIYAVGFGAGWLLQRFLPAATFPVTTVRIVTPTCLSISGILAVWSFFSFWRAHTSPLPIRPSAALVTTGPYGWVRNPMYVSLVFLYVGLAFWYDVFWAVLLLPAVVVSVRYLVLAGEERYLEQKFGDEYRRYKARVPRWIPRLRRQK